MVKLEMGLGNKALYEGCEIKTVGGKLTLITLPDIAKEIVGANAIKIADSISKDERDAITLSGPMAVWAYIIVSHAVIHRFGQLWYDDGRTGPMLLAQH